MEAGGFCSSLLGNLLVWGKTYMEACRSRAAQDRRFRCTKSSFLSVHSWRAESGRWHSVETGWGQELHTTAVTSSYLPNDFIQDCLSCRGSLMWQPGSQRDILWCALKSSLGFGHGAQTASKHWLKCLSLTMKCLLAVTSLWRVGDSQALFTAAAYLEFVNHPPGACLLSALKPRPLASLNLSPLYMWRVSRGVEFKHAWSSSIEKHWSVLWSSLLCTILHEICLVRVETVVCVCDWSGELWCWCWCALVLGEGLCMLDGSSAWLRHDFWTALPKTV